MKQAKKLTREQKECLSAHNLMVKDWSFISESEFYFKIINKRTNQIMTVDKFRRKK